MKKKLKQKRKPSKPASHAKQTQKAVRKYIRKPLIGTKTPPTITEDTIHKAKVTARKREIEMQKFDNEVTESLQVIFGGSKPIKLPEDTTPKPAPVSLWKRFINLLCELKP